MKALVFEGNQKLVWKDWEAAEPGPGEALVSVRAVGICGSDLHGYTGKSSRRVPPMVMGHEATGVIMALGKGCSQEWLGQRVVLCPILACGECEECKLKHTNRCLNRRFIGGTVDGAMAEQIALPLANLVSLPEDLSFEKATLTEPLAVGLHAVHQAGYLTGKSIFIAGCGPIGLFTLVAAKRAGAEKILVTDLIEKRRQLALEYGAELALDPIRDTPEDALTKMSKTNGVDLAFDAVGIQDTFNQALNSIRRGGTVVALGGWRTVSTNLELIVTREQTIIGTFNYTTEFQQAAEWLAEDQEGLEHIITHTYPLSEGGQVFQRMVDGNEGYVKVVLTSAK